MFDCLILGDSLAQGVSWQMPECHAVVVAGMKSRNFYSILFNNLSDGPLPDDYVLISLGSNDNNDPDLEEKLDQIRSVLRSPNVTWLLCANSQYAHDIAEKIASKYKDNVIEAKPYVGKDGIHPSYSGYGIIANKWKDTF